MAILSCPDTGDKGSFAGADWPLQVLCRDSDIDRELFFSDKHSEQAQALICCQNFPVRAGCLAEELMFPASEQHGIRGGLSASQRRKLLVSTMVPTRSYRAALLGNFPGSSDGYPSAGGAA